MKTAHELAEHLIREHAKDIEYLSIVEKLPDDLAEQERDELAREVDTLIRGATVTVQLPDPAPATAPATLRFDTVAALDAVARGDQVDGWTIVDEAGALDHTNVHLILSDQAGHFFAVRYDSWTGVGPECEVVLRPVVRSRRSSEIATYKFAEMTNADD